MYAGHVNTYYELVTDLYEKGLGQSFHFSPQLPGKTLRLTSNLSRSQAKKKYGIVNQLLLHGSGQQNDRSDMQTVATCIDTLLKAVCMFMTKILLDRISISAQVKFQIRKKLGPVRSCT